MRLLEFTTRVELSLAEFIGDNISPYAIFSHTLAEDGEITFNDLEAGSRKTKAAYKKFKFCGDQAACDGFRYFWVDSCCP